MWIHLNVYVVFHDTEHS